MLLKFLPHIIAGSIALLAGAAAVYARKGSTFHRRSGSVFVVAMGVLTATGLVMSLLKPERLSAVNAVITLYLVMTAWATVRRRPGTLGKFEYTAATVALGCCLADIVFGVTALKSASGGLDGYPAAAYFIFAGLAGLGFGLDVRTIASRGVSGTRRLARHIWRISVGFFVATSSFFLGQQKVMPEAVRGSPLLFVLALAPLAIMFFWLWRVRDSGLVANKRASQHLAESTRHG